MEGERFSEMHKNIKEEMLKKLSQFVMLKSLKPILDIHIILAYINRRNLDTKLNSLQFAGLIHFNHIIMMQKYRILDLRYIVLL